MKEITVAKQFLQFLNKSWLSWQLLVLDFLLVGHMTVQVAFSSLTNFCQVIAFLRQVAFVHLNCFIISKLRSIVLLSRVNF